MHDDRRHLLASRARHQIAHDGRKARSHRPDAPTPFRHWGQPDVDLAAILAEPNGYAVNPEALVGKDRSKDAARSSDLAYHVGGEQAGIMVADADAPGAGDIWRSGVEMARSLPEVDDGVRYAWANLKQHWKLALLAWAVAIIAVIAAVWFF